MEPKTKNFHKSRLQNLINIFHNACTSSICQKHSQAPAKVGLKCSRSEKWKNMPSLLSEKWKVKMFGFHSFSRGAKWKFLLSLFFEEWKVEWKWLEIEKRSFSRIFEKSQETRFVLIFCLPKLAQNMVWININFMSPPTPPKTSRIPEKRDSHWGLGILNICQTKIAFFQTFSSFLRKCKNVLFLIDLQDLQFGTKPE